MARDFHPDRDDPRGIQKNQRALEPLLDQLFDNGRVIILEHDSLVGLADDDHAQYHNDARGDARYFREDEHLAASAGAADAGKPIKLDAAGHVDASMVNDADVDHGALSGLADDDHQQYVLLAGRAGGQTILQALTVEGGVTLNDLEVDVDLLVKALGGIVGLFVDGATGRVGIGTASPVASLEVERPAGSLVHLAHFETPGMVDGNRNFISIGSSPSTGNAFAIVYRHDAAAGSRYLAIQPWESLIGSLLTLTAERNVALFAAGSFGGGVGVLFLGNRTTGPTASPAGGGVISIDAGVLKYIGQTGAESSILTGADNLASLVSAATARANLGLGSAAVEADTKYAHRANNLSDLASAATARANLGLGAIAVEAVPLALAKGGTGATTAGAARTNLELLSAALRAVGVASDTEIPDRGLADARYAPIAPAGKAHWLLHTDGRVKQSFYTSAAPEQWVRETDADLHDTMVRLVTTGGGTAKTPGRDAVSNINTQLTAITEAQMPSHTHNVPKSSGGGLTNDVIEVADGRAAAADTVSEATGGGQGHLHEVKIRYADFLVAKFTG